MGIISALLTGGVLVGKVCQAISGVVGANCVGEDSSIIETGLKVGGGEIMISDDNTEHTRKVYLYNTTTKPLSYCIPDNGNGTAIELIVKGREKLPIDDTLNGNAEPDTEIIIGPVAEEATITAGGISDASLKLSLSKMQWNEWKGIGSIEIEADLKKGLTVSAVAYDIASIVYLSVHGSHGVDMEVMSELVPDNTVSTDGSTRYNFAVDFSDYGFVKEDVLNMRVFFSSTNQQAIMEEFAVKSEPLTENELQYMQKAGKFLPE